MGGHFVVRVVAVIDETFQVVVPGGQVGDVGGLAQLYVGEEGGDLRRLFNRQRLRTLARCYGRGLDGPS